MAKGKNSVALFEVIRAAQQKQQQQLLKQQQQAQRQQARAQQGPTRSASDLLWQPIFWFKGKLAHQQDRETTHPDVTADPSVDTAPSVSADREVESLRHTLSKYDLPTQYHQTPDERQDESHSPGSMNASGSMDAHGSMDSSAVEAHEAFAQAEESTPIAESSRVEPSGVETSGVEADRIESAAAVPSFRPEPVRILNHPDLLADAPAPRSAPLPTAAIPFLADPAQVPSLSNLSARSHDSDFRLSYVALIAAGFAIVAAVGLAIMFGREKDAAPTASVPKDPSVLQIAKSGSGTSLRNVVPANPGANFGSNVPERSQPKIVPLPANPITPPANVDRVAGLQYVIMQSYPYEGDARQAVKDLADNGIAATVEKGLSWSPKWYCVVGTRSFEHCSNNPEYDSYLTSINAVNEKRTNVPKFQRFQPNPYRWGKTK